MTYINVCYNSDYIKKDLANFAKEHPQIEIVVQPRPAHHPIVRGYYCKYIKEKVLDITCIDD
jgi:hypothetical protein